MKLGGFGSHEFALPNSKLRGGALDNVTGITGNIRNLGSVFILFSSRYMYTRISAAISVCSIEQLRRPLFFPVLTDLGYDIVHS